MSGTHKSVRKIDTSPDNCQAVAETLDRIGDKWTVLVVGALEQGPLRYNEIRRVVDACFNCSLSQTAWTPSPAR